MAREIETDNYVERQYQEMWAGQAARAESDERDMPYDPAAIAEMDAWDRARGVPHG